ncbi:replication stress response regulator SDE2-like [Penaeus chinensis]|uniref:replication stress response regulator SDE2-like n=1 Tax=Penaeus chinensis TaxID=139456 RepID=UPI001FB7255A|nr:replication stress response regulator SDE2-like [Penaeus chinensis]
MVLPEMDPFYLFRTTAPSIPAVLSKIGFVKTPTLRFVTSTHLNPVENVPPEASQIPETARQMASVFKTSSVIFGPRSVKHLRPKYKYETVSTQKTRTTRVPPKSVKGSFDDIPKNKKRFLLSPALDVNKTLEKFALLPSRLRFSPRLDACLTSEEYLCATMVLLVSHVSGSRKTWCLENKCMTGADIFEALQGREGQIQDVVLQSKGQILSSSSVILEDETVTATLRLPGGKGGFGSMLRAIGAQIEKTTNREACRDLSGRRLRDINEEKRLKEFISKKSEREREVQERKRQKFEKLKETPKHVFQDESYYQQREVREKNLYDSLDKAFSKETGSTSGSQKRSSSEEAKPVVKPKKGRFLDDLDESSGDDSDSDEEEAKSSKGNSSDEKEDDKASGMESGKEEEPDSAAKGTVAGSGAKGESDAGYSSNKESDEDTSSRG